MFIYLKGTLVGSHVGSDSQALHSVSVVMFRLSRGKAVQQCLPDSRILSRAVYILDKVIF